MMNWEKFLITSLINSLKTNNKKAGIIQDEMHNAPVEQRTAITKNKSPKKKVRMTNTYKNIHSQHECFHPVIPLLQSIQ